jgi:hypothetical protein
VVLTFAAWRDFTRSTAEVTNKMPAPRKRPVLEVDAAKLSAIELNRIVPLAEAVQLSSLSDDVWRREHADKFVWLSPRRIGVRLKDALMLEP